MYKQNRILITGGSSFLGRNIAKILYDTQDCSILAPSHEQCDLLDYDKTIDLFCSYKPDYVYHLATYSGNIQFNTKYPYDTYSRTSRIGLNVFDACRIIKPKRILSIISSCAYPDIPIAKESDFYNGLPNQSIESHGLAKRNLLNLSRQIWQQDKITAVCVVLNNLYGPGDSFNEHKTKAVGGLIKRIVDAKRLNLPTVECWGTGEVYREYLDVRDAARLVIDAMSNYDDWTFPLNISSSNEITIKKLAETIKELSGYQGELIWLKDKPNGQYRKSLNCNKMKELFGQHLLQFTSIETTLKDTIKYYESIQCKSE